VDSFQAVGCRYLVSLRVGLNVISEFCGLLAVPFPSLFCVLLRLWLGLAGAVAGALSGIGSRIVSLGFSGLFGLGVGRSLGLAFALGLAVWSLSSAFGLSGLGLCRRFQAVGFGFVPSLSGSRVWFFSFVVVGLAELQPVLHGWPGCFLARCGGGFRLVAAGCCQSGGVGVSALCGTAVRRAFAVRGKMRYLQCPTSQSKGLPAIPAGKVSLFHR
jgi:hypothetical protein